MTALDRMFDEYKNRTDSKIKIEIALLKKFQREAYQFNLAEGVWVFHYILKAK